MNGLDGRAKSCWRWFFLLALAWCIPHALQAQTSTEPADQYRRQSERESQLRQQLEPQVDVHLPAPQPQRVERLPRDEQPCFPIRTVKIVTSAQGGKGLESIARDALARVGGDGDDIDTPEGACLGSKGIAILMTRAQGALVAQGYVTARVLASPQNLQSQTLELTLIPGIVKRIIVQMESGRSPARWNTVALAEGEVLNLRDVEQTLENFKRLPSVDADFKIEPAEEPGQSQVRILHKQGRGIRLTASVDDAGYKSTGIYQGSITLSLDNTLTLSDLFYVTLNNDIGGGQPGPRGTQGNTLHYSMPIGYWTVGTTFSKSRYHQSVAGIGQTYLYSGSSDTAELSFSRNVYRDGAAKTDLRLKAFARGSNNYIDDTEVQVQRRRVGGWELGIGHRQQWNGGAQFDANMAYKRGTGSFGSIPAPEEATGDGTSHFSLISADGSVSLPWQALQQNWRYTVSGRAQSNLTRLTPQDRFSIGNRYSVRGFDGEQTLVAERGWFLRNEFAAEFPGQQLYAGIDYGEVSGPSSQDLAGTALAGGVLGWRGGLPLLAGRGQYDFFVGWPLYKPEAMRTANTTAGFNLSMTW